VVYTRTKKARTKVNLWLAPHKARGHSSTHFGHRMLVKCRTLFTI